MATTMTVAEYTDPKRFPLTTQPGIKLTQQLMLDAMNYDELHEADESGALLTEREKAILAELEAKNSSRAKLSAEPAAGGV